MTDPKVPLRLEFSVEVPGTAQQVWAAIATANGITSWMMPTELEERAGGAVVFHMGADASSEGTVTGWEPPHRLVYEEPNWAALVGQEPEGVTPLVTEFLVETTSGGTCLVRVVSSAFGSGADWEREFFDDMSKGWLPMFENLRLYLTHFAGQQVTPLEAWADVPGTPSTIVSTVCKDLGIGGVGQQMDVRGVRGTVERVADDSVLLRLTEPIPGLLGIYAFAAGETTATARVAGYLFSDDAPAYVQREQPAWQSWIEGLAADARQG